MGQALSAPITEKVGEREGANKFFHYAASSMQGWRISMEDQHTTILNLNEGNTRPAIAFFGVYDASFAEDVSGCTAVSCVITADKKLVVANAGDSRIILSTKGQAVAISMDHKPTDEAELARIINAENGRVNGNLALSRAFGDFDFKRNANLRAQQQAVTIDPDVFDIQLTSDDDFLVLACDGIWDVLSNQQVIDYVRHSLFLTKNLLATVNALMGRCLAPAVEYIGIGCDNMTVVIVALLAQDETIEQWIERVAVEGELTVFGGLLAVKESEEEEEAMDLSPRLKPSAPV